MTWFLNWSTWLTSSACGRAPVSPRGNGHLFLKAVVTRRPYPYWLMGSSVGGLIGWMGIPNFSLLTPRQSLPPNLDSDRPAAWATKHGRRPWCRFGSAPGGVEGADRGMVGGTRRKLLWFLLATFHTRSTFGWLRERSTQRSELVNKLIN